MKITVAELIRRKIEDWKVRDVPIFQGGAIMNVLSEISISKKIKHYCPYHEQALSMGVDAYSRIKGFGVGLVTSGPGATNLTTGIACSFYDSVPSIYFTGQVGQFHITGKRKVRQRGFQESDIVSLLKPITKFCYQIEDPNEANFILDKAYHLATTGRPGPVVIDLPFNIQKSLIDIKKIKKFKFTKKIYNEKKLIKKALEGLGKAKKPLVVAGGGIRISKKIKEFHKFIKRNQLPFITTWPAQDITESKNNHYFGSAGRHAHLSATNLAIKADVILTLGVRFSPKVLANNFGKNAKIFSIDIDKGELNDGLIKPDLKINCSLEHFFNNQNLNKFEKKNNWLKECRAEKKNNYRNFSQLKKSEIKKYVNPYTFTETLSKLVKNDAILLTDAGANLTFFMQAFQTKKNQRLISAWGNSPMGYSVAAGIGAKIASKNKQVISLIGDGSFLINLQELQFIKFKKIGLKIVIYDNKVFGNTKIGCRDYKINNIGNDRRGGYFSPEVKKIAKAFDIKYFYLKNNINEEKIINDFLKYRGSSILHLNMNKDHELIEHSIK
jgi:acetolactate synthase I/II/III large subunit